jgi:hypothetical protein
MAFAHHPALGILLEKGHQRLEMPPGARAEVGFAGRTQDVAEGEYQALSRLLGLEGGEFLLALLDLPGGDLGLLGGSRRFELRPLGFPGARVEEDPITLLRGLLPLRRGHLLLRRRLGTFYPLGGEGGEGLPFLGIVMIGPDALCPL